MSVDMTSLETFVAVGSLFLASGVAIAGGVYAHATAVTRIKKNEKAIEKLETIGEDVGQIKTDVALIKARLNNVKT